MEEHKLSLPKAVEMLGLVVDAFQLRASERIRNSLADKQAQRFFRGEPVSPEKEGEILRDLVTSFLEVAGPVDDAWRQSGALSQALVDGLADALRQSCRAWNHLRSDLLVAGLSPRSTALPCGELARLHTIDMALRLGAGAACLSLAPVDESGLTWMDGSNAGQLLRNYLQECSPPLTRESATQKLGCAKNSMDAWLDGSAVPRLESMEELAQLIADATSEASTSSVCRRLGRHYGFSMLLDALTAVIPAAGLRECFEKLVLYARTTFDSFEAEPTSEGARDVLLGGAHGASAITHLEKLAEAETDTLWLQDLLTAPLDWEPRLRLVVASICAAENKPNAAYLQEKLSLPAEDAKAMANLMARMEGTIDPTALATATLKMAGPPGAVPDGSRVLRSSGPPWFKANNRAAQGEQALALGDYLLAAHQFEKAVEWAPARADLHFKLGHSLALLGMDGGDPGLFKRAEHECRIAALAEPDNAVYVNEVAVVRLRANDPVAALRHLDEQCLAFIRSSLHLSHNRGKACSMLELWDRAIDNLERALELEPQSADTLDELGHCLLMRGKRGDRRRGTEAAKQASRLGSTQTMSAYEAGRYS